MLTIQFLLLDPEDKVSAAEVGGKEAIVGIPNVISEDENSGEDNQDITEDGSLT